MFGGSGATEESSAPEGAPGVKAGPAEIRPRKDHYAPGLDGIRGVAVAAIVAYHVGLIDGGLLSVSVFFTLSGYLITSILLATWRKNGGIGLKIFWLRRARRLLPALLMLLGVVVGAAAIARPQKLATYGRQAFSAMIYMANWATIARGDTYFNRFSGPGPFDHLWSLAIEEQFYAVWPPLFLGMLLVGRKLFVRGPGPGSTRRASIVAMIVTALLAVASAIAMAKLFVPTAVNNTRAYEGTDARAAPILLGSLTAMLLPLDQIGEGGRVRRIVLDVVGAIAAIVVVKVVASTDENSPFLYRGGESVVSIASAVLVLAAGHPQTWIGKLFGLAPLRWLGVRTYGIYLWHMPIVAFMPTPFLEDRPFVRSVIQAVLTLVLSALSWTLVEDPIRRDGLVATFVKAPGRVLRRRWAGALVLVPLATVAVGIWPFLSRSEAAETDVDTIIAELETEAPEPRPIELAHAATSSSAASSVEMLAPHDAPAPFTSCTHLIHIGDSTSLGLMSKKYIPLPEDRLDARYGAVGVELFVPEISGGRSIVEKLNGHPSAYEIVSAKKGTGYQGCWVFALGIGDAANVRGNVEALSQRMDWMMKAVPGTLALWTTTKTLLEKGPYQNAYMESWNRALVDACASHPEMRVYDWASEVQDDWYLADKIHPNEIGSKERAARIANALAVAFPKDRPPVDGCVVHSTL